MRQYFSGKSYISELGSPDPLQKRVNAWQQARTWARLIREAESLWKEDQKEIKRIGELELSQLLSEIPKNQRQRVNRWLKYYLVTTRLN